MPVVAAMNTASVDFGRELCEAFLSVNIPLHKLADTKERPNKLRLCLEKYTKLRVPSENTLRKTHVPSIFDATMRKLRNNIGTSNVYIIVDESTNARGEFVANLLIGTLLPSEPGDSYLVASRQLTKTNADTVTAFVNNSLIQFYDGEIFADRVLLLVTDAAPYMVRVGKNLKTIYPNLISVTCIAHAIHRLCEKVRDLFPDINSLVSSSRKIFFKCPARIEIYKQYMHCELPPDVVVTRWGTWIEAAVFFAIHYNDFSKVVDELRSDDSKYIAPLKTLMQKSTLRAELAFVNTYLSFLSQVLIKLQTKGLSLNDQLAVVDDVTSKIHSIPGTRGLPLIRKVDDIFQKNEGLLKLRQLNDAVIHGFGTSSVEDPAIGSAYTYAPMISVDVERSFSDYKLILTDRRHAFTEENLEKHIIVMFNSRYE